MVPRQYVFREHVDDHQVGFAEMLIEQDNVEGIRFVFDIDELSNAIKEALQEKKAVTLKSLGQRDNLINALKNFISNLKKLEC